MPFSQRKKKYSNVGTRVSGFINFVGQIKVYPVKPVLFVLQLFCEIHPMICVYCRYMASKSLKHVSRNTKTLLIFNTR